MVKSDSQQVVAQQRVWLAVLGKHPGWNDHLDDIGLDTERLVGVKRRLYVDSVGGVINAGTWEQLAENEHDPGYAHSFFWRQADGMVVGRMWSSSDGKGRDKYPMIACAMCRGLPFSFVAGPLLDRLRKLEDECRRTDTAPGVIGAADRIRAEVTDLASFATEVGAKPVAGDGAGPGAAAKLAESGRLGGDAVGLKRVLYQIDREMGAYIRPDGSGTASRSRSVEVRGQHIRVPTPNGVIAPGGEAEAMGLWTRLLLTKVDPLVPLLLITRDGRDWVDIVVGEPGPTQLACLQSTTEAMPLVSDIPFTIDGEIETGIDQAIESSKNGESVEKDPCFIDVPQDRLAPFLRPKRTEARDESPSRTPMYLAAGLIAVVVVALLAFFAMRGGGSAGGDGTTDGGSETEARSADPEPDGGVGNTAGRPERDRAASAAGVSGSASAAHGNEPAPPSDEREPEIANASARDGGADETDANESSTAEGTSANAAPGRHPSPPDPSPADLAVEVDVPADPAGRLEAFVRWCDLYESWFGPFVAALDDNPLAGDPAVRSSVRAAIARAERAGDAIDPLISTPGRFRNLDSLRESPPDGIYDPAFGETIAQGLAPIESIRAQLRPANWQARRDLQRLITLAGEAGAPVPAEIQAIPAALDGMDGVEAANAASWVANRSDALAESAASLDALDAIRAEIARGPAAQISDAFAMLSPVPDDAGASEWIDAWERNADEITTLGTRLLRAAADARPRVDPGLFERRMADAPEATDEESASAFLAAWLDAVTDRSLYLLDPQTDPRRGLPDDAAIASFREELGELTRERENGETRELAGMLDAYENGVRALRDLSWNEATKAQVTDESSALTELAARIGDRIDAEARTRALEAESYIADLRETGSVSETGSPAIDAAWVRTRDRAIAAYENDGDIVALSRTIDEARAALAQAESAVPRIEFAGADPIASAAGPAAEAERERRLTELCAQTPPSDQAIAAAGEAHAEWARGIEKSNEVLARLRSAMGAWRAPDADPASWEQTWIASAVDWRSADPEFAACVDAWTADDPDALRALAGDPATPAPAAFAAWRRLGEVDPGWGTRDGNLAFDRRVVERLRREIEADGERASRVRTIATERWLAAAESADEAGFPAVASAAEAMGVDESALPWDLRYDLFVTTLRTGLADGAPFEREALVGSARGLLDAAGSGGSAQSGSAVGWLTALVDELAAREGREVDYRVIGPARAGWAVEPFDSGRVLRYTWTDGDVRRSLTFRLVESPEAGVFYLSETEAPAWLLTEYALESAHAERVMETLPADWEPIPDTRLGPRVWDWGRRRGGRGIRIARSWVTADRGSDRPYYPADLEEAVGRPGDGHPIQRVSSRAAAVIAAAAGCRLPTEAEWRTAYGVLGSPPASADWNLRDRTFDAQRAHTVSLGSGIAVTWPDQQSFADGMEGVPAGPEAESRAWSDGVLWFVEAEAGRERPFRHLVGNVSEFVLAGLEDPAVLTDRGGSVGDRVAEAARSAGGLAVIGGSALSPPSVAIDRAVRPAVDTEELGYSDAGFRLAFSPGVEAPLVVVLGELLGDAPFLRGAE